MSVDEKRMRGARLVVGFIGGGTALVLIVMTVLGPPEEKPETPMISYVALAVSAMSVGMRLVVPGAMATSSRRRIAAGTFNAPAGVNVDTPTLLFYVFQARAIVGAAVLDGAALLCAIAYRLEGQVFALALGFVLCAGIAVGMPTRSGFEQWRDDQERRMREERDLL